MCSHFDSDDLQRIKQQSNDIDYSSCCDNIETSTHLTIASMLKDKDQYNIVTLAVFFCGVGSFLTFMTATAAPDYIHSTYPSHPDLLYLLVCVYNTSNMIGVMIMVSPAGNYISLSGRMSYGYILTAIFTTFIPFIPYLFASYSERSQVFLFLFMNGFLCGLSSAILCTSLFAFAAMLPNAYLVTAVSGQSLAGVLAAAIRIINKLSFTTDTQGTIKSGIGCFVLAAVIQSVAAIVFMIAFRTQFVNRYLIGYWAIRDCQYLDHSVKDSFTPIVAEYNYGYVCSDFVNPATGHTLDGTSDFVIPDVSKKTCKKVTFTSGATTPVQSTPTARRSCEDLEVEMSIKTVSGQTFSEIVSDKINSLRCYSKNPFPIKRPLNRTRQISEHEPRPTSKSVTHKLSKCVLSIFIGYCATYLVFPSLMVDLEVDNAYLMRTQWNAVILYTVWSICGLIGIYCGRMFHCCTTYDNLWIVQLLWMCIMYALFLAAQQKPITSDVYVYGIVALSPLILCFLSARTFAELPQRITKHEREIAQAVTQLTLIGSILLGGWIAYTVNKVLL
eukprot:135559_1